MRSILLCGAFILSTLTAVSSFGADFGRGNIKKLRWGNLDVVWLQDERFPTYSVNIYFADGSLSDGSIKGTTSATFDLLSSGTRRFSQKDIAENLEFFGVGHGASVVHENVTYSVSGLAKDIIPTMKKICHLFNDATFPSKEVTQYFRRFISDLDSLENSKDALADRAFRSITLRGTPYAAPTGGSKKDAWNIKRKALSKRLNYFNTKVKKRIYINGPSEVLSIKNVILNECGWKGDADYVRSVDPANVRKPGVYLVTIPKANQAQVRIGRYLHKSEFSDSELLGLMSEFLGGGFTSKLMRELRVNRGLVYSVGSYAAGQRDYGRAAISTATKNKSVGDTIAVIRDTIDKIATGAFEDKDLQLVKQGMIGRYPFKFEDGSAYISRLSFYDHVGKKYDRMFSYQDIMRGYSKDDLVKATKDIFSWDKLFIVVLGTKDLKKQLSRFGKVKVISHRRFL